MSLAYVAPGSLAGVGASTPVVTLNWDASALLGTPAALLNFDPASLYIDDVVARTWAASFGGAHTSAGYAKPSGGYVTVPAGTNTPPLSSSEKATDGLGSALFVAGVGVGGNGAILYSDYAAGLNPGNTDWTIEGFYANAQPYQGEAAHFGTNNPVLWYINDSDVNGIGSFGYQLQRTTWPDLGGTVHFYVLDSGGVPILDLDTGCDFSSGQWWHIAVSKLGNDFQVFVNGVLTDSGTITGYYSGSVFIALGNTYKGFAGNAAIGGWYDEFRYVRGHTVYWDDTYGVPEHDLTGYAQAYVIYRDGVQYAIADNMDTYQDTAVVPGLSYYYKVAAWDNVGIVSAFSDEILVEVPVGPPETAVYAKFAGARAFAPINIANMRGVRPRIYMPLEDTTVRTGK